MRFRNLYCGLSLMLAAVITLGGCGGGGGGSNEVAGLPAATVISTSPKNKATSVATNSSLFANFSKPMQSSTINSSTFLVSSPAGPIPGTVTYSNTTEVATFQPTGLLPELSVITATLTTGINDNAPVAKPGHAPLQQNYVWTFTTTTNDPPPTVASTVPANLATGVSPSTSVSVTFNKPMNAASINGTTFTLTGPSGPKSNKLVIPSTITYANGVAVLSPSTPLAADSIYTATVTTGVTDVAGSPLASNYSWTFTTALADIAPTIVSTTPLSGAVNVSPSTKVSVTFSEAINAATVTGTTFSLATSGGVAVPATLTYSNEIAILDPTVALIGSTTYVATVTTGIQDVAGTALAANHVWQFTTATTDVAPKVVSTVPANTSVGVAINSNISATFSESMSTSTINTANFTLTSSGGTAIPATVTYSNDIAVLAPSSALTGNTVYTALISTGVQDVAGTAMVAPYSWTFTTDIPPTVLSTTPLASAINVPINTSVTATFSKALLSSTVNSSNFTLTPANGTAVSAIVSYANNIATLVPTVKLTPNTVYTASVTTGITDVLGTPLAATKTWTFTTDVPPTITGTFPLNGATQVGVVDSITATFNKNMTASTINGSTFLLSGPGGVAVNGTVTYLNDVATFAPTNALAGTTQYTATVTTGAQDAAGTPLANSYSWSFTTGQAPVNLGLAGTYAVLAGSTVTNTGPTMLTGNLGVSPGTAITGFPPGQYTGTLNAGNAAAAAAKSALLAAEVDAAGRLNGNALAGDLAGLTIYPGLYTNSSSVMVSSGNVTFDAKGDSGAVFVLQMGSTLTTGAGTGVILAGGAKASNIYWSVGSSATLGVNSSFSGVILSAVSITVNTGTAIQGLMLTQSGAVTLASNTITVPPTIRRKGGAPKKTK